MPRTGKTAEETRASAIDTTLALIRKHGFEKVRLVDIAKELGVSHAALYAHFTDKAALLDAVTERWLSETNAVLDKVCRSQKDPRQKIQDWFVQMYQVKRKRVLYDPELYRAFDVAAATKKPYVIAHLAKVNQQLIELVKEASGTLGTDTPQRQATILFEATSAFHHPKLMGEHFKENREALLKRILNAVMVGMSADR